MKKEKHKVLQKAAQDHTKEARHRARILNQVAAAPRSCWLQGHFLLIGASFPPIEELTSASVWEGGMWASRKAESPKPKTISTKVTFEAS